MTPKWKTRGGKLVAISDMETSHIKNALALLKCNGFCSVREFNHVKWSFPTFDGEMAQLELERSFDEWLKNVKPNGFIDLFEEELSERGAR